MSKNSGGVFKDARGANSNTDVLEDPLETLAQDHMRQQRVYASVRGLLSAFPIEGSARQRVAAFLKEHQPHQFAEE